MFEILCTYIVGTVFAACAWVFDTWMMGDDK